MDVAWLGLVDRLVEVPDGEPPVEGDALVASTVVRDVDLPRARDLPGPVTVALSGGAGGLGGPIGLAARLGLDLVAVDVALRDLDDLAGNARRICTAVGAARDDGSLAEQVTVRVGLPPLPASPTWLTAVDVVAEADLRVGFRLDAGTGADVVLDWVDAALDRERPFTVTAGLARAWTDGPARLGFVNLLLATTLMWDGISPPLEVLTSTERHRVLDTLSGDALDRLAAGRRWFTGFATADVAQVRADLDDPGLRR